MSSDEKPITASEIEEKLGPRTYQGHDHSLSLSVNAKREVFGTCRCGAVLNNREEIMVHAEEHDMTVVV